MDNKTLDIFEAMNELYESVQNNLILIANKQLFKNLKSKNWKDIQLSRQSIKELNELLNSRAKKLLENMQESTLNAFKVAGIKPDKTLIATNEKAMGVVIGSARQYYKGSVTKIWRLDKTDDLYNTILEQSKEGIEKGLPIKINNRNYEFKSYMEMKVRTTISHQIVEQQMELNLDTQNVFFIVNYFGDCAKDHKDLQGKIYYDDRYKSFTIPKEVKEQVANIISQKKLMSMQEAIEKPYWLTTRPNCRHRFVPITIEQALGNTNNLLNKLRLKKGTYKDAKYQASQQLRAAERNIRKYKALLNQYQEIYKTGQNSKVLPYIDKYKGLVKKWQKQARIIVDDANSKGYDLERDYRRETRNVIVKDLGVKYNGDDGKPPIQEPEVVVESPKVKYTTYDKTKVTKIYSGNDKLVEKAFESAYKDETTLKILNNIDKLHNVSIKRSSRTAYNPSYAELTISSANELNSFYHELGHSLDHLTALYLNDNNNPNFKWISEDIDVVRSKFSKELDYKIPDDISEILNSERERLIKTAKEQLNTPEFREKIKKIIEKKYGSKFNSLPPYLQKSILNDIQTKEVNNFIKEFSRSDDTYAGWEAVSDILDALTDGKARNSKVLLAKHGWDYYYGGGTTIQTTLAGIAKKQNSEIFANFVELKLKNATEQLEYLKSAFPELYEELENCYKKIGDILDGNNK